MYKKNELESQMKKSLEALEYDFQHIRAGRANPNLLDDISFSYYGVNTPIKQAATINVPEARLITITPWDKTNLKPIEQAIISSDLGITPSNDGTMIRLPFPQLTEERRKDLVKDVNKRMEEGKVAVRNIRREGMEDIKKAEKNKEIAEDDRYRAEDDLQKLTDKYIEKMEEITKKKEKELMEV